VDCPDWGIRRFRLIFAESASLSHFLALKVNELRKLAPPFALIPVNFSAMLYLTRPHDDQRDLRLLNCGVEFRSITAFVEGLCFCFASEESRKVT
jgi:hypothetical protein